MDEFEESKEEILEIEDNSEDEDQIQVKRNQKSRRSI